MRPRGPILAILLLCTPVGAQMPPAPPPQAPPAANALDNHLRGWEQAMKKVSSLQAVVNRIEIDTTFNKKQEFIGFAQYLKDARNPNAVLNLATLEMRPKARPTELAEKIICTGTHLYVFVPQSLEIKQYELPKPKGPQVGQDNVLSFLFGMRAIDAKQRYEMNLSKEDQYYIYIDVTPRYPADKADFLKAQLILDKSSFLPRRLAFTQPNGGAVTWDIPNIKAGVEVKRTDFDAPTPPPGWKIAVQKTENGDQPPKIIRSGGQ